MKKVFSLFALLFLGVFVCKAQKAYLLCNQQTIHPNESAVIEFWFGNAGSVDLIAFTIKDQSTGEKEHYETTDIPCRFEVFPEATTTYELTYARNRYGEIDIDPNRNKVTISIGNNTGMTTDFFPRNMCLNEDDVDLSEFFRSNPQGENLRFEGTGVVNRIFFRPSLAGPGTQMVTAKIDYNGFTYSTTRSFIVYDMPEVKITGIPTGVVSDTTAPFVLIGVPSGGVFYGSSGLVGNTFIPSGHVGENHIYYTYSTPNQCTETVELIINVKATGFGVDENNSEDIISIFPNPTNGVINFTNFSKMRSVKICNRLGQMVETHDGPTEYLDISHLSPGFYFICVYTNDGSRRTTKVVKN